MTAPDAMNGSLRWRWSAAGVVAIVVSVAALTRLVDPTLERLDITGVVATATLMLAGVVIGRFSPGETIREAGLAGVVSFLLLTGYLQAVEGAGVRGIVWVAGPFYAASLAMAAAWAGEMLQGTVEEAYDDHSLDWPWVFVCVVCGFVVEAYAVFVGGALFSVTASGLLVLFVFTIFLTGCLVGALSPGFTAIEPAVASVAMVILSAALAGLWLADPLSAPALLAGGAGGLLAGVAGGFLGETLQRGPAGSGFRRMVRGE
ncbi:MAG TPA: hypothetical protein VK837_00070 [Longimicrobiales bacterium]|nr:hypothetical protein [Longimicrobiales bacterium]